MKFVHKYEDGNVLEVLEENGKLIGHLEYFGQMFFTTIPQAEDKPGSMVTADELRLILSEMEKYE